MTLRPLSILAKAARLNFRKVPCRDFFCALIGALAAFSLSRARVLSYPRIRGVHAQLGLPPRHAPAIFRHVLSPKPSGARTNAPSGRGEGQRLLFKNCRARLSIGAEVALNSVVHLFGATGSESPCMRGGYFKGNIKLRQKGIYAPNTPDSRSAPRIFERLSRHERGEMFDWEGDQAKPKPQAPGRDNLASRGCGGSRSWSAFWAPRTSSWLSLPHAAGPRGKVLAEHRSPSRSRRPSLPFLESISRFDPGWRASSADRCPI